MGRFRHRAISVIFMAVFLLMIISPPVEQRIGSQTREIGIQQSRTGSGDLTETDYAIGNPTYVYGSSTSGSYTNTFVNDSSYHVSTSAQYDTTGTTSTLVKASSYDVEFGSLYNGSLSDTYTYNSVSQGFYDNGFAMMAFHYHFYLTNNTADQVTDLTWKLRGCATGGDVYNVRVDIFVYNFLYGSWNDWGDEFYESQGWINVTRSVYASQYISSGGEMRLRMTTPDYYPYAIYSFFDFIWWNVTYHTHAQRIDFNYLFDFTGGTPNTVASMTWTAKGKTNYSTTTITLFNWINSIWDSTDYSFNTTDKTYTGSVDRNYYMHSLNGSIRMRFSQTDQASPFTVSADYLAFTIIYTPTGSPLYGSVIATANPAYTYGSLSSGGIWQTWTKNDSYQVSVSASYYGGSGSSSKATTYWLDNTSTGTRAWSNPSYAQSSNDQRATVATSAAGQLQYSHYLWGRNFGFSIPDGSPITGILVQIEASKSATANTYAGDNIVRLLKAGVLVGDNKAANSYTTTDTTYSFGGSAILWGATWSEAEVEAFGFGVAVSCYVDSLEASGNAQAQIDYISITVYYSTIVYRIDFCCSTQFTAADKSDVYQLGWLMNGKVSGNALTIYLYNWGTTAWDSTGQTLTSTQADKGLSSISVTNYMGTNGSLRIRFYLDAQASSFTVSIDMLRIDIIYAQVLDSTPPNIPNLFYPLNDQALDNGTLLVWNSTLDNAKGSGISYYQLQLSQDNATWSIDRTTDRTWYKFGYGVLAFTQWYWKVRAIDHDGNQGGWSEVRYFYQTSDPQAYVVLRDQNNAAINEYLNLAAFNITYHRSIQDGAGVWNTLSPYMPVINMFSSETVNITVRDWLGNYIVNNQQYSYSPTILVNLDIWDVCIGNGADQMAYIIMRSGSVFLHQFTYRSDLHWLVIAGNYNLTVIYPAVGNIQVYYNLTITGDYGIKVSSNATADLYSASTNWDLLTSNVASIVTTVQGVKTDVYNMGWTQADMKTAIQGVASQIAQIGTDIEKPGGIISDPYAALKLLVAAISSPVILGVTSALLRAANSKFHEADQKYKTLIRERNETGERNFPNREHVTNPHYAHDRRKG